MASYKDQSFIDFVMESKQAWLSLRQTCKDWTEQTWETCSRDTVNRVLEGINPIEWLAKRQGASLEDVSGVYVKWDWSMSLRLKFKNAIVKYHDIKDELIKEMNQYSPKYPKLKRNKLKNPNLLVVNPADIHIGKLWVDWYNVDVAISRVREWVQGILDHYQNINIDKIIFVWWNDILHTEWSSWKTTKWTDQSTDWLWYNNFWLAKKLYIEMIELLLTVADVTFVFCPSNHDYASGYMLCDTVASWFHNNDNITFDVSMNPRKYVLYWNNLLWFAHWNWAKPADLPLHMATESWYWKVWQSRYVYGHHVHHKIAKDYIWVSFETSRSASWTDPRHKDMWYCWVPQAIEWFLHWFDWKSSWRFTYIF